MEAGPIEIQNTAYAALKSRFAEIEKLNEAASILHWDRAAVMPDGGAESRAVQLALLARLSFERSIDPEIADLIAAAKEGPLEGFDVANLSEMDHHYTRVAALPADLIEAMSLAESRTEMLWRTARDESDFSMLAPKLAELLGLVREKARILSDALGLSPYDALLDGFDQGRRAAEIDLVFDDLAAFLPPFLEDVLARQASGPEIIHPEGPFDEGIQKALGIKVMGLLGFDFRHGRLDESHHPFSGGTPDDCRITTRYDPLDFTSSLMGVIHETGHALYEQGLPQAWRHQPVGSSLGMTIHETQSLLFEMQAARSPEFVRFMVPVAKDMFGGSGPAWDPDNLVRLYHKVAKGFIRVDADEVTYPLHVILRFRLERAMIAGDLKVTDLPGAWSDGMEEFLGVRPPDDRHGCLQDIHWPSGAFGYFPTYTLGAMGAAQLFQAARTEIPDLMERIGRGDFTSLLGWLRTRVHNQGRSVLPAEVIENATGKPLDADALKRHLSARYLGV